jgi:hypothetical protein
MEILSGTDGVLDYMDQAGRAEERRRRIRDRPAERPRDPGACDRAATKAAHLRLGRMKLRRDDLALATDAGKARLRLTCRRDSTLRVPAERDIDAAHRVLVPR